MRELAGRRDAEGLLVPSLAEQAGDGEVGIDVAEVWRASRASCPARHWHARHLAGTLEAGPAEFVAFHVDEMGCEWCGANRDDLSAGDADLDALLEKLRASTALLLRSRTPAKPV